MDSLTIEMTREVRYVLYGFLVLSFWVIIFLTIIAVYVKNNIATYLEQKTKEGYNGS